MPTISLAVLPGQAAKLRERRPDIYEMVVAVDQFLEREYLLDSADTELSYRQEGHHIRVGRPDPLSPETPLEE